MNRLNKYKISEIEYRKIILEEKKQKEDLNAELHKRDQEIHNLKNKIIEVETELEKIFNSKSWKLTKPLRRITSIFKNNSSLDVQDHLSNSRHDSQYYKNFTPYTSEYQNNIDYSGLKTDIKAIAFYLPQFHTFKENDEWWGEGFTEWTNTKKAYPRFENHYQPRVPHKDIGYYDLSDINVLKKQIELAKQHGLFGFCFYYYWFSGKRLMEKPVDMLLKHPEINFPFCLCWANENWTRTWDGLAKDVLIAQEYSNDDYKNFMVDIKKYIDDKRYIRIDNKPVILVYNPYEIPNLEEQFSEWRKYAKEIGIGEILIWARNNLADTEFERADIVDGEFDFSPIGLGHPETLMTGLPFKRIVNYTKLVHDIKHLYENHFSIKPFYYSCMMGWDNSARRKEGFVIFNAYSLKSFYDWLSIIVKYSRKRHAPDRRFIFINAWNEWAEGTYLEPDQKYGYANINTVSKVLFDLPFENDVKYITNTKLQFGLKEKIAIQIHLYNIDLMDEIMRQLKFMPFQFDIYITTDTKSKSRSIQNRFFDEFPNQKVELLITENRGRDVAPFLTQMKNIISEYDFICHIHTKKSSTAEYGERWRKYLFDNLFGSTNNIIGIFHTFASDPGVGLIYPATFPEITNMMEFGGNRKNMIKLAKKLNITEEFGDRISDFPSGTMFWAKVDAIKPLFELKLSPDSFDEEDGQLDGTLAHAIERIFCYLVKSRGYKYVKTLNRTFEVIDGEVTWYHS